MLKKPLLIATMTAALGLATLSQQASAGDPLLGALIGGGIGAAIGHNTGGRNGGVVGGVLGAVVGSSIAASSNYYDRGYYDGGYAPGYGPAYYAPAPVYAEPVFVYGSGYSYPRYGRYEHAYARRDWRDGRNDHRR
jgi:Glycine zipper 2TM domain